MSDGLIYTIGHSVHPIERFIALLKGYQVEYVLDVRSRPYSAHVPQYNRETLRASLQAARIEYLPFDKEFGARYTVPDLLDETGQRVDFAKVRATDEFRGGVVRLKKALALGYRVALMCSEGNPLQCHRFSMIAYQLARKEAIPVAHIFPDGGVVTNQELEQTLLKEERNELRKRFPEYYEQEKSRQLSLFIDSSTQRGDLPTYEELVEAAYRLRERKVAYHPNQSKPVDDDIEQ